MQIREILGYDPRKKPGPPSLITPEIEESLIEHIAIYNDLYLDEMADFLFDEYDVKVSISVISRLLSRLKITNKKLKIIA
jgi:transposase